MAFNARIETFINVKINFEGQTHRLKLSLRDLVPSTLPGKLYQLLDIPQGSSTVFERYSDSARAFVVLDPNNVSSYKQLYRAARAKLRLRLRATVISQEKSKDLKTLADSEEKSTTTDTSTHSNVSSSSNSSIQIYSKSHNLSSPTVDALDKSSPTISISDIQRTLQNPPSDEQIDLKDKNDRVSENCYEVDTKIPAPVLLSELPMRKKCPFLSRTSDKAHVIDDNRVSKNGSMPSSQCPFDQRNYGNLEDKKSSSLSTMFYALTVYCNNCGIRIFDQHYHCSNCENGDYDLCQKCVDNGIVCHGENHWLIKRVIKDGEPVNSTTETIISKSQSQFKEIPKTDRVLEVLAATRTCNCCIKEFSEENFVTCITCPDYDLCMSCHVALRHGHNPKHAFEPVIKGQILETNAQKLLAPGRNVEHDATCDGCDKFICGVRYKCSDCPDWDYCSKCISKAETTHPDHRFIPIYEQFDRALEFNRPCYRNRARHHGVFCDGPHCKNISTYICGDRYKCAVCDDTDYCANCEASPENTHNSSHPLIKLKIPIRNVNVTTLSENCGDQLQPTICDKRTEESVKPVELSQPVPSNAATQVQTIFELRPSENSRSEKEKEISCPSKKLLGTCIGNKEFSVTKPESEIIAHFVRDTVVDGSTFSPNVIFIQTWYLRNAGELCWPSGCYIKCLSGTNMSVVDSENHTGTHNLSNVNETEVLDFDVKPGQVIGFTVLLKAPSEIGNFISFWRLMTPSGQMVGPKLWCDINVKLPTPTFIMGGSQSKLDDSSEMVFPKLEKEINTIKNNQKSVLDVSPDEEAFDDLSEENLEEKNIDEPFLTDDEYDILDASDEEFFAEQFKKN